VLGEKPYLAGQNVPHTGIYRVFHYQHRMPHDVVVRQGEQFPACNKCGDRVYFVASTTAEPVLLDRDFMTKAA